MVYCKLQPPTKCYAEKLEGNESCMFFQDVNGNGIANLYGTIQERFVQGILLYISRNNSWDIVADC